MKIGEVSKITNLSVDTIRYYINYGLLVPKNKGKQYTFSESDIQDLQTIKKFKSYYFSLKDIHTIISFNRISNLDDRGDLQDYLEFFEDKYKELNNQKEELENTLTELKNDIDGLKSKIETINEKSGVPIFFLEYLSCPHCKKHLKLFDAQIEKQEILSGKLFCDCSYSVAIKDGILNTNIGYINTYDFADPERNFSKNISPSLISLIQKSYNWMLDKLDEVDLKGKIIMEDHINAYFFLYPNISKIDKDAYYIVCGKYLEILELYKHRLDSLDLDLNILYICDSSFNYPIKDNSVDIFIDYYSSNEYATFNNDYHLEKITPYLKNKASILGTYFYFDNNSRSRKELFDFYKEGFRNNFNYTYFKDRYLTKGNYEEKRFSEIGYTLNSGLYHLKNDKNENEAFIFHVPDEKMHLYSYEWEKN